MLVILDLAANSDNIHVDALRQVDDVLTSSGFRKEVHSVTKPGKAFSITYEGPSMDKLRLEELIKPLSERYSFSFSLDVDESVKFP